MAGMVIQVECQSLDDALEAAGIGADIVMLDNFLPESVFAVAKTIKEQFPHVLIEASGVSPYSVRLEVLHT